MSLGRLTKTVALGGALALLFAASALGEGALVIVNGIVLRADGGFHPRALPRHQFTAIDFQGRFDVEARGGGKPVAVTEVVVDFDRDGRLGAGGLPVCAPERVAAASPAEARRACGGSIVGTGHVTALVDLPGGTVPASSALTIFNGPRQEGGPTVILHARVTVPAPQTIAVVVPIERRPGAFRYRTRVALPPIAGGLGAITHVDVEVGRHFMVEGRRHSYIAARCSDGILHTHGRFTFADGTIVDGSVEKPCRPR